ncbi:PTS sugar transporter subunit IIC [Clostridium neonatale]|uniref:Permease IIC component n=1 Tax=Clostridium neonatale TaxID=137838 RepID=A0A2A7MCW9_9CLOT|nr:PTS transporter subunit EIIC [Clostridium neonatale]PEG27049.1 PTS sugar transporter subunit IIC [Clostridium neonatale]PEG29191.1 PTS sugar transporter subunit IIC [Clostridium neonatale]CAH0435546.1 PTS system, lactose/cellobiose-family IIC component [Clostridium neonatale]
MKNFSKIEDGLLLLAEKIDGNKYLGSIKNAFTDFVPFIIVGSFGTLLNSLIANQKTGLAQWIPLLANLKPAFDVLSFATVSCMTIPIVFLIAMHLAKDNEMPQFTTGVLSLCAYLTVVPSTVTVIKEELKGTAAGLGTSSLGAQGLFVGMLIAVVVAQSFNKLMKIEKIKIKMPSSVPKGIAISFNTLIPIFIILVLSAVFGNLFKLGTGYYLNEWIYSVAQAPLEVIFQSSLGIIFMAILSQLFWFLGIHGGLIIEPIRSPLSASAIAANIAAINAGGVPSMPITRGFWTIFVVCGGAGITLSLIFVILKFSKREDHRMIAKMSLLPGICGIGEPIVFGLPLVLNPVFAIPFIINSGIAAGIALSAIKLGFLTCNTVDAPFGLPIFINAMLSYGWKGIIIQIIILAVCTIIWIPFVLMSNRAKENV